MGLWDNFVDFIKGTKQGDPTIAAEEVSAPVETPVDDELTGGASIVEPSISLPPLQASTLQPETQATKEQALLNEISAPQAQALNPADFINPVATQTQVAQAQAAPVSLYDKQSFKDAQKIAGGLGYSPSLIKPDTSQVDNAYKESQEASKAFQISEMQRKNKIAQEVRNFDNKIEEYKKTPEFQTIMSDIKRNNELIIQKEKESKKLDTESSQKIDPNRFWDKKEGWQKALILIGQSMAAFASGFSGRENTAFKLLMKSVDDDIEAQKESIRTATSKKQVADNMIQTLMSQGFTMQQAALQLTAAKYNQYLLQINTIAQNESTPEQQKIAGNKIAADISSELAKTKFAYQNDINKTNAAAINESNKNKATLTAHFYEQSLKAKSKGAAGVVTTGNYLVDKINSKFSGNEDFVSKENFKLIRKEADEYQKFLKEAPQKYAAFKNLASGSFWNDFLPSYLGGGKEIRKSDIANMSAAIIKDVPGLRSDTDYRNIILPMLPSIISTSGTKKEVVMKMAKIYEDAKFQQFPSLSGSSEFKPEMTRMAIESGYSKSKRDFEKAMVGVK